MIPAGAAQPTGHSQGFPAPGLLMLLLAMLTLAGCLPPKASYKFGLGTTKIVGFMSVEESDPAEAEALIVIYKYHYKFVTLEQEDDFQRDFPPASRQSITHPTAHVQSVGSDGRFSISMPSDVTSINILFIARDHLTDFFQYSRSLGIGEITYRANLPMMEDWRSHYYTYLEPQLQHLIVEKRYGLMAHHQKLLGDWLVGQKERLEEGRKNN